MQGILVHPVDPGILALMRKRGGKWAAYENKALDSANCGHLQFLQYGGPGSTYATPPEKYPFDTSAGMGWRYVLVGYVGLDVGAIRPTE